MKFIVRHSYLDEVDVRLAPESREKLNKFLIWTSAVVMGGASFAYFNHENKKKSEEK